MRQIVKVLLVAGVLYFCGVLTKSLFELYQARGRISEAEAVLSEARRENEELKTRLEVVKTEEFKEKEVRDKLNRQLPGETVVIVPERVLNQAGEEEEEKNMNLANWQKWLRLFSG